MAKRKEQQQVLAHLHAARGEWHTSDMVANATSLPEPQVRGHLRYLREQGMVEKQLINYATGKAGWRMPKEQQQ